MKIAIGADHAGWQVKEAIVKLLRQEGHTVQDVGTFNGDVPVDYPDYAYKVASLVAQGQCERGILICGSGIGVCIAANKVKGVRAALVNSVELARLSRAHNNSNVLALGARLTDLNTNIKIVKTWLTTAFEAGRHQQRVSKIAKIEEGKTF